MLILIPYKNKPYQNRKVKHLKVYETQQTIYDSIYASHHPLSLPFLSKQLGQPTKASCGNQRQKEINKHDKWPLSHSLPH